MWGRGGGEGGDVVRYGAVKDISYLVYLNIASIIEIGRYHLH